MQYKSLLAQAVEFFMANSNIDSQVEKQKADIDYIAMMTDVDLDTGSNANDLHNSDQDSSTPDNSAPDTDNSAS